MPKFSEKSMRELMTCDQRLRKVMFEVVRIFDITVIEGHRSIEDQERAFNEGKSKVHWNQSTHCKTPSMAVDVAPYPVNWKDRERFYYLAGIVKAVAWQFGITIRWGGDWDEDQDFKDQTFDDLCHFEVR